MTVQYPDGVRTTLHVAVSRLTSVVLVDITEAVASHNEELLRAGGIPLLYESGEVYVLDEGDEPWFDVIVMLPRGGGDCEDLVAKRLAELRVYGARALRRGDVGYGLTGEVQCRARMEQYGDGSTHMQLEVRLANGVWQVEDPAARLGMTAGVIDPLITQRWKTAGVQQRRAPRWR